MPGPGMFYSLLQTDLENFMPVRAKPKVEKTENKGHSLSTSEKIRYMLTKFPSAKPNVFITDRTGGPTDICRNCIATNCKVRQHPIPPFPSNDLQLKTERPSTEASGSQSFTKGGKIWGAVGEVVQLLQLAVSATALVLYYVIFGWMQLVYTGLRVAVFFRDADGPMKVTLGVVTVTSLVVAFNLFIRIQKLYSSILR